MAEVVSGLEDVVALESAVSSIIEDTLTYRGIKIDDLVGRVTFEEVAFLLWHGRLPDRAELDRLMLDIAVEQTLPQPAVRMMAEFPRETHPVDVLRTVISALALYDPDVKDMSPKANLRKSVRLLAKVPTAVASFQRLREGQQPVTPIAGLPIAENFLYMLRGQRPDPQEVEAMQTVFVVYADHELNASTFAARVAASTLADLHCAITAAISTLKGRLHGGANQAVMEMLEQIGDVNNLQPYVKEALARHERIMGFGHRVYKHGDPRAKHLRRVSKELADYTGERKWYEMSVALDDVMVRLKDLHPNVDYYVASVLRYLGMPADLYTAVFACGRMAGWTAHVMEQYAHNRLIRPRSKYVGPTGVHFVPIEQRGQRPEQLRRSA